MQQLTYINLPACLVNTQATEFAKQYALDNGPIILEMDTYRCDNTQSYALFTSRYCCQTAGCRLWYAKLQIPGGQARPGLLSQGALFGCGGVEVLIQLRQLTSIKHCCTTMHNKGPA